jgi:hypothetical protein
VEAAFNHTMNEWIVVSRCNRVATTLFGRDRRAADVWGQHAYAKWQLEGIEPEDLACQRAPGLAKRLGRGVKARKRLPLQEYGL